MKKQFFIISVLTVVVFGKGYGVDSPYFSELPPGFLSFEEFEKKFNLGSTSTEKLHPMTETLSQTMHQSISEGLKQLLLVDEAVIEGVEGFIPSIKSLAPLLANKIGKGGRIFLVGSGSSGRIAIDLAAKCKRTFPEAKNQVEGIIAGGDSALIRAKEGFEDSESDGMHALENFQVGPEDTVILISASGSASFNVGCATFAADRGSHVLYFYNSRSIPSRTECLFERKNNPILPLCIDIGPQAIAGSTRLQAATLAEASLGALLATAFYLNRAEDHLADVYPVSLVMKMRETIVLIKNQIESIAQFVFQEKDVFSNPDSNFRRLKDETDQGYVTFIAPENSMREVLIDTTETSPTFSTNSIRREEESHRKRAEFRAYLVGEKENKAAWEALLGRSVCNEDVKETEAFLLSYQAEGVNSYKKRPVGEGNFLIGVVKLEETDVVPEAMMRLLEDAKKLGGKTGLLLICKGKREDLREQVAAVPDTFCLMENVPHDSMGLIETIFCKQTLNLISNGSMVLMNKVHGNQMIDMRASNQKLIDRCIRIIKSILIHVEYTDEKIYHDLLQVNTIKKSYEEKGIYTPSVVKIVLAMLALKKSPHSFEEVVDFLNEKQERVGWIIE